MHGLFHQPSHMDALRAALERRGARVSVPMLHRGAFEHDVSAVQRTVDQCASGPVLVGHSYGGAVIADVLGGRSSVFIAAFVPEIGESCADLGGPDALVDAWVRPHPSGGSWIPAASAPELFYADCTEEDAARATALLVPQAGGHGRGRVRHATWKQAPSHYVVCDEDRAVSPMLQRRMSERCTSRQHLAASHSPYISQPDLLAEVITGR